MLCTDLTCAYPKGKEIRMKTNKRNADGFDLFQLQQTKVLLIDDDRTIRRMVSMTISDYCSLQEAIDAQTGLEKIIEFEPDIVFLDLNLPDDNGHNILKWVMNNKPDTRTVVFSEHHDTDNLDRAIKNGASGYVAKPFDPKRMMQHICHTPKATSKTENKWR